MEQPKYLEMTLSQLKSYVESSESNVLLVVEFPKGAHTIAVDLHESVVVFSGRFHGVEHLARHGFVDDRSEEHTSELQSH